jgi:hypothetical protein
MKFATRKKGFLFVFLSILWRVMKCDGAARITGVRVEVGVNHYEREELRALALQP